jgi:Fur family ferric uptake transcriptional regulator
VRSTRQRTAVADLLARWTGSAAPGAARPAAPRRRLGRLTTVYRHLQALSDAGHIDVLRTDGGEAVYRRCPTDEHHHHLVCRSCGRSVEVEGPEVEAWASAVAERHGFTAVSHTVEVFGTCAACAGAPA